MYTMPEPSTPRQMSSSFPLLSSQRRTMYDRLGRSKPLRSSSRSRNASLSMMSSATRGVAVAVRAMTGASTVFRNSLMVR